LKERVDYSNSKRSFHKLKWLLRPCEWYISAKKSIEVLETYRHGQDPKEDCPLKQAIETATHLARATGRHGTWNCDAGILPAHQVTPAMDMQV
jgi:hypothetical protein